jgi:hypothetical protein
MLTLLAGRYEKVHQEPKPVVWKAEFNIVNGQDGSVAHFKRSDDTAIRDLTN